MGLRPQLYYINYIGPILKFDNYFTSKYTDMKKVPALVKRAFNKRELPNSLFLKYGHRLLNIFELAENTALVWTAQAAWTLYLSNVSEAVIIAAADWWKNDCQLCRDYILAWELINVHLFTEDEGRFGEADYLVQNPAHHNMVTLFENGELLLRLQGHIS